MTRKQAAEQADWSESKIGRIEKGPSRITVANARILLSVYGIEDPNVRASFEARVGAAKSRPNDPVKKMYDLSTAPLEYWQREAGATSIGVFRPVFLIP